VDTYCLFVENVILYFPAGPLVYLDYNAALFGFWLRQQVGSRDIPWNFHLSVSVKGHMDECFTVKFEKNH